MRSPLLLSLAAAFCAAAPSVCSAQSTITLFGTVYSVTRIDYAAAIQLPNIPFPQDPPVPFIESEGVVYVGNDRILMSADDISDAGFGMPDNWIVEAQLSVECGKVTGIESWRQILSHNVVAIGYDLNPTGITLNSGTLGLAAGGNIVGCLGDGSLYAYSYQPGSEGAQLEFPSGSGCLATPATCAMDISSRNTNAEDVAYVPVGNGQFFVTNQDFEAVERWDAVTGEFLGLFPVGGAVPGGPSGAVAKGLAFVTDSDQLPAAIRDPGGVILVCFDDNYPALQAFDTSGNLLGTEILTVDGTAGGASRLDVAGCPGTLQIESLTADPETGRLFISNQGSFTLCNYLYVLTPEFCAGDFDRNGVREVPDIFAFLSAWFVQSPCADFDSMDGIGVPDIFAFLSAWFAGC